MTIATNIAGRLCTHLGHIGKDHFCADCVLLSARLIAAANLAGYTIAEPVSAAPSETGPALIYITTDGTRYQLDQMPPPEQTSIVAPPDSLPARDRNILLALWRTFTGDNPMSVWNR